MKQLWRIFIFDIRMSFKNFMGAYLMIVPIVILLILRSFLPAVDSTTAKFAVVTQGPNAVDQSVIDVLAEIGEVIPHATTEEMERRLRAVGELEGLYWDPLNGQYVSVVERTGVENESFTITTRFIRQLYLSENYPDIPRITSFSSGVPAELSDRTAISPVATMGGSIFIVFINIMVAFIMGLAIVEDKDQGTILALRTSPVSTADYYVGRSLFPFLVTLVYSVIAVFVLGLAGINILQMIVVIILSFSSALVFGLFIGGMGKNEVEAMGIGKVGSMVFIFAILGATLLPRNWHWVVWWSPMYWTYDILEGIFTQTADWISVIWKSGTAFAVAGVYFLLLRGKIAKGLSTVA